MGDYYQDYDEDDWTLVQRGGRRRRARQPRQDYGGGWRARASPVSYGRRDRSPSPNRPVPPPRPSRYGGPQSRSYAAVVRQDFQRPARRFGPPRSEAPRGRQDFRGPPRRFVPPRNDGNDQIKRQAAGPQFRQLTRKLHALIKMVHHLQNVAPKAGKQQPRMIARMVEVLTNMIRPAYPTNSTFDWIKGNAVNWGHNTQLILQEHYENGLETLLDEVHGLLAQGWKEPFQVAVRWARRNLPHLTQEVIEATEALITARDDSDGQPQETTTDNRTTTTRTDNQGQRQTTTTTTRTDDRGQRQTTTTVTTRTDGPGQGAKQAPQLVQAGPPPPPQVEPPQIQDLQPPQREPMEQRLDRSRVRKGVVLTEDLLLDFVGGEVSPPKPNRSHLEDLEDLLGSVAGPDVRKKSDLDPGQVEARAQIHMEASDPEDGPEDGSQDLFDLTSTPMRRRQWVTRHANSDRKMIDWDLMVSKKWLIIGDSNLSRIPPYDIPGLQIDSYPGANFRHAEALMGKASSVTTVLKVVLSFGLNHRNQKARETSIKQLQGAVRATKRSFPYAEVWVPQINFSSALAEDEKQTLKTLNDYIAKNLPGVPGIEDEYFRTEDDNLHWTENTARNMLDYWATLLNLTTL